MYRNNSASFNRSPLSSSALSSAVPESILLSSKKMFSALWKTTATRFRCKPQTICISVVTAFAVTFFFLLHISPRFGRFERSVDKPPSAHVKQGDYDLPNILNIPAFQSLRDHQFLDHNHIQREARSRPGSILAYYAAQRTECRSIPSITRLRRSVDTYYRTRKYPVEYTPVRETTLVIHHDPAKLDVSFVDVAVDLSKNFDRVRLLVPDSRLEKLITHRELLVHYHNATDDVIAFMGNSAHLLVHTGETSALGALVAKGTVYHTGALSPYTSQNAFKWLVQYRVPLSPEKITRFVQPLNHMGRVRPTCCDLQPFGEDDEEKIVCANTVDFTPPCWILAVGSAGHFGFERGVLKKTKCHIHTFDCTGRWEVPKDIADRVTLHHLCLGSKNDGLFRTWEELIKIGSSSLPGATKLTMPSFAKMDIEGYEFPVIQALVDGDDQILPQQIAMEVHQFTTRPVGPPYEYAHPKATVGKLPGRTIGELFLNLSRKGYDLVYRADNPFCPQCSEVTVVRRSALPAE